MTGTHVPASESAPQRGDPRLLPSSVEEWLASLRGTGELGSLLSLPWEEQLQRGYGHTVREIAQQPVTWAETVERMRAERAVLAASVDGVESIVVTGSGSSHFAAECAVPWLQAELGVPASAVPGGTILTHPETCLPPRGPFLVVSVARSGDSPESRAVVDWLLESRPQARHLFITCNRDGALATAYAGRPGVQVVVLDEKTNDRSLVMTSSFTNLVLAARGLGGRTDGDAHAIARAGGDLLRTHADALATVARRGFSSVVYLGSGCRTGSAREAALKMLETNAGDVWTLAESFLGLRHGPMSAISPDTLVVAFLSSDPRVRPYEMDLLAELDRKDLGRKGRVVVGAGLPNGGLARDDVLRIDCAAAAACDDGEMAVLDAMVGQLLAFFRCLATGRRPDSPSEDSVITRVVSGFQIHSRNGER